MSYTLEHKSPTEPRALTRCLFCRRSRKVTESDDDMQTWTKKAEMVFSLLIQVFTIPVIMLYDPSHSAALHIPWFLHLEQHGQIPDVIRDPSPAAFMLACLAYAFTAATFYRLHPNDRYQRPILLFVFCTATIWATAAAHSMRSWVPLTITTALLLSSFTHSAFPRLRVEAVEEVEGVECKDDRCLCQEKQPEITSEG